MQKEIQDWIHSDLPRWQKQEEGERKVGFGDLFVYDCGGTHVTSLGKIGAITLGNIKFKKGNLIVPYSLTQ